MLDSDMAMLPITLLILLLFVCYIPKPLALEGVSVVVRGSVAESETDDYYICATIDWWPPEKCDYGRCSWGHSSILNLDIRNPFLVKAVKAFKPLRIRLGGSLQDQVIYEVPNSSQPCLPFERVNKGMFGFSQGCLPLERWDELNLFFMETGAIVIFGLNALNGRQHMGNNVWAGSWNSTNAQSFINYTISKGYQVHAWELGNELSGWGVGARINAELYGKDAIELHSVIHELYNSSQFHPLIVAPGGFYEKEWYTRFLQVSGPNTVNAITHHMYDIGPGNDNHLVGNILNPNHLDYAANTFRDIRKTLQIHGPWSCPWVGEAGGAYNSGGPHVSDTFVNSFWYLNQLGMAAKYNTKVHCRQTLIGGNYGLLNKTTFRPNPDFYSALLWHQLMGKKVLSLIVTGSKYLRAYAHCAKQRTGISLLLINLSSDTDFDVAVRSDRNVYFAEKSSREKDSAFLRGLKKTVSWIGRRMLAGRFTREEYHLTAQDGDCRSGTMFLNGIPLELTENGEIPTLKPVYTPQNSTVRVASLSIAFVIFSNFEAGACS